MKIENEEMNNKPIRANVLTKVAIMLSLVLIQIKNVAAWSFETNVLSPMWVKLKDFMLPIVGIILVAVGMGKASTIEGIPNWTKALLAVIAIFVCLGLAMGLGTIGSVDIGSKFESFFGKINIFD